MKKRYAAVCFLCLLACFGIRLSSIAATTEPAEESQRQLAADLVDAKATISRLRAQLAQNRRETHRLKGELERWTASTQPANPQYPDNPRWVSVETYNELIRKKEQVETDLANLRKLAFTIRIKREGKQDDGKGRLLVNDIPLTVGELESMGPDTEKGGDLIKAYGFDDNEGIPRHLRILK